MGLKAVDRPFPGSTLERSLAFCCALTFSRNRRIFVASQAVGTRLVSVTPDTAHGLRDGRGLLGGLDSLCVVRSVLVASPLILMSCELRRSRPSFILHNLML